MNEPPMVSLETLAAQAMGEVDPVTGDLVPAIHMSTTFERQTDGSYLQDRVYTHADNPTFEHAERLLAALEGGASCALFASGMAATTAIFQSLVPGDHVLVARVLYWGVRKWLAEFAYEAYGRARSEGHPDDAALAVMLIDYISHPVALDWVDEFLEYEPTADPGLGLLDQALFHGVIYPDDERLENWLRTAEAKPDPYIKEVVRRIRESMARWTPESAGCQAPPVSEPTPDVDEPPQTSEP